MSLLDNKRNLYQNVAVSEELETAYKAYIDKLDETGNYCRCEYSMIICDMHGCRCQRCGKQEKTLPDVDYLTWLELRFKSQERTILKLQNNLDEIKQWYEEAKYLPGDSPSVPVKIWNLMQKLGDLFGNKN